MFLVTQNKPSIFSSRFLALAMKNFKFNYHLVFLTTGFYNISISVDFFLCFPLYIPPRISGFWFLPLLVLNFRKLSAHVVTWKFCAVTKQKLREISFSSISIKYCNNHAQVYEILSPQLQIIVLLCFNGNTNSNVSISLLNRTNTIRSL